MNVEIGTEAAQFPEKEYINGLFVAVQGLWPLCTVILYSILQSVSKYRGFLHLLDEQNRKLRTQCIVSGAVITTQQSC
jgi:hypothetical protein